MDEYRIERDVVGQYLEDVQAQTIEPEPNVQRDFCWTKEALNGLVASAVSGTVYIPNLILSEVKSDNNIKSTYIVDGGQRTEALRRFRYDGYKVTNEIREPIVKYNRKKHDEGGHIVYNEYGEVIWESVEYDLRGKTYEDLPKELKRQFNRTQLTVTIYQNCTPEESAILVNIYNNHTAMNTSQKALTYIENFAKEIRRIKNTSEFLRDCTMLTESDKKRGFWERVISECVMGVCHFDEWKNNPKKMCDYLNDHSSIKEYQQIENYFNRIVPFSDKLENKKVANLFKPKDILVWIIAFDKFTELGMDDESFGEFLNSFDDMKNKEVNGVTWEELDENKNTKDKKLIKHKVEHILYLMKKFFGIEVENDNTEDVDVQSENTSGSTQEIENENGTTQTDDNILEGIEPEDLEFYEQIVADVLPENSVLAQKGHDELVKLVDYCCEKDYDTDLEKWLKTVDETILSSDDKVENYNNMKKLFIEYMLNQEKNVA